MFIIRKITDDIFANFVDIEEALSFLNIKNKDLLDSRLCDFFSEKEIDTINSFKNFKVQKEWISSRFCVKKLFNSLKNVDFKKIVVLKKKSGAPYIENFENFTISISHSFNFATSALSLDEEKRVGIDIEDITQKRDWDKIKKIAFSNAEILSIKNELENYYKSWTIKEAFSKYIEKSFFVSLKEIEVIGNNVYYKNKICEDIKVVSDMLQKKYIFSIIFGKK